MQIAFLGGGAFSRVRGYSWAAEPLENTFGTSTIPAKPKRDSRASTSTYINLVIAPAKPKRRYIYIIYVSIYLKILQLDNIPLLIYIVYKSKKKHYNTYK